MREHTVVKLLREEAANNCGRLGNAAIFGNLSQHLPAIKLNAA